VKSLILVENRLRSLHRDSSTIADNSYRLCEQIKRCWMKKIVGLLWLKFIQSKRYGA